MLLLGLALAADAFGPAPRGPVSLLSVGNDHACVIGETGALRCWTTPDASFALGTVPAGTYRDVEVGMSSTCALDAAGAVRCFGNPRLVPQVPPGTYAEMCHDVALCLRGVDGAVACHTRDGARALPPTRTGTLTCGGAWSCGLTEPGELACVEADRVMAQGSEYMPAAGWSLPKGPFTAVVSGYQHGCALRPDGTVACWGRDVAGETEPPPGTFTKLALGEKRSCGLASDGAIHCWGG
ncbi:MAG: hypothetical protein ACK4YP_26645, partial [Myxococcota bacterium]